MAFAVQRIEVNVQVVDDAGTRSSTSVFFDPAVAANQDYANLTAFAAAFAAAIDGLSTGKVDKYSVNIGAFDPVATVADATSNVERKAAFIFQTAAGKTVKYLVPSIDDTLVDVNDTIDITAGAGQTLADLYVTGDGTVAPADSNGSDIALAIEAYQYHQKSHLTKRRRQG